jgi:hypothetical protein
VPFTSCSEANDDRDVLEGDWRGLSMGETELELAADESVVTFLCSATRFGIAVDDILASLDCFTASVGSDRKNGRPKDNSLVGASAWSGEREERERRASEEWRRDKYLC